MSVVRYFNLFNKRIFKLGKYVVWNNSQARSSSTDILYTLMRRGLVKEIFPKDAVIKTSGLPCAYAGFDATAGSLHIGNLLILIALIHWQRSGNQSIVVIGDATAQVGDPSGHKTERDILATGVIKTNADSIEKSIRRIFENHETAIWNQKQGRRHQLMPVQIFRNSSWYKNFNVIDLISNAGRHLRVGEMLSRTSVKSRMDSGEGINFSEFSYQLFQSYDWLHLFEKHKCQFQFGGNDQTGNITTGYQMITGKHYKSVYGALLPLIESESGNKYGKSSGTAVYLNSDRTNAFELYQFFLRLPDADIKMFLNYFTFLSPLEVENVVQKHMKNPDGRFGQRKIAEEVLLLIHGEKGLESAQKATKAFYQSDLDSLRMMSIDDIKQVIPNSALVELPFDQGISLLEMTMKAKCFIDERDANRIISDGGVYLNLQRLTTPTEIILPGAHILSNGTTLIRIGKKTYYLVIWK